MNLWQSKLLAPFMTQQQRIRVSGKTLELET
jgi:hypothetical protein